MKEKHEMIIRAIVISVLALCLLANISCSEQKMVDNYVPLKRVGEEYVLDRSLVTQGHFDRVQELLDSRKISFDRTSIVHIKLRAPIGIERSWEITQAAERLAAKPSGSNASLDHVFRDDAQLRAFQLAQENKFEEAFDVILPIAKQGDVKAAYLTAEIYTLQKNMTEAIYWHKRAAEAGFVSSMMSLHILYLDDEDGVPKDADEAMMWLEKAAIESGDRSLQEQVYFNYIGGNRDIPANEERAEYWRSKLQGQN